MTEHPEFPASEEPAGHRGLPKLALSQRAAQEFEELLPALDEERLPPPLPADTLNVLEAILLCAGKKVTFNDLLDAFWGSMGEDELTRLLDAMPERWADRGFELAHKGGLWWVRAKADVQKLLHRVEPAAPAPRASKVLLETLAVIVYTQPCTKGDIEERRGMSVGASVLEQLETRGWIEVIGNRNNAQAAPLYATTNRFLDDMGMLTLEDMPEVDLKATQAAEASEDFDAYVPYDGPMPLLPGDEPAQEPASEPSASSRL